MPSNSIIKLATGSARRTVSAALAAAFLLVFSVIAGGISLHFEYRQATGHLLAAQRLADQILAADERRAMALTAAAASGDAAFLARFEASILELEGALMRAAEMAPQQAAARLEAETRPSRAQLSAMERAVAAAASSGDTPAARAGLGDPVYQYHREISTKGIREFLDALTASAQARFSTVQTMALIAISAAILLSLLCGVAVWYLLNASLQKSEGAYRDAEKRIESLAMRDMLTGLANRRSLREELRSAIARAKDGQSKLAVLMIDLDRFKPINDHHGHLIGDLVLKEVALRISRVVRKSELCGRYGGDEFMSLVEYTGEDALPRRVGHRLVEALSEPMSFRGVTVEIGASVGFAVYPSDAKDEDELIRKADTALYSAKNEGRGDVRAYNATMDKDLAARAELHEELRHAIRNGFISPYYQPIVELSSGRIAGFEVLSRWHHPVRGLIAPAEFIRPAEEAGLINELTMCLLQKACLDARNLPHDIFIAVNVAPRQIQDEWLAHKVLAILTKTRFPAQRLEIELTEHALVNDVAAARQVILALKGLGIKVALDDFGTGYSSLSYLSELPFDRIKIDRSFIRTLHSRPDSAKIVSAIVGLGANLGVSTIAEGVETERDAETLRTMGCKLAQGYLYSAPVPAAELDSLAGRSWAGPQARAIA